MKILKYIFLIINIILFITTTIFINKINIIPNKYLIIFIIVELLLILLSFLLLILNKKTINIIGIIIFILLLIFNILFIYYLNKTNTFIDKGFVKENVIKTRYYLIGRSNSFNNIKEIDDNYECIYYKYSKNIDKAINKKDIRRFNLIDSDNIYDSLNKVINDNKIFLIGKANYDYLINSSNLVNKDDYKIIYEFDVDEVINKNNNVKDTYNIYIAGLDFTGIMRDYNLLVSINTKTKKVLLTSIPRDYYIDVDGYNIKDTLMCLGAIDSDVSKKSLEKLFDTNIDYIVNLNTNNLVDIVDKLGGIDFCSDVSFTTTHDLVLDTYNDSNNNKLRVEKGCRKYNGIEILTIARERNAFVGRDRVRQENCRKILINIIKKIISISSISNYSNILDSFSNLYITDMNKKVITNLFKDVLDGNNYEIIENGVDGEDKIGLGHLGTVSTWVMEPNYDTVEKSRIMIKEVLNS